jgi:SAM-dependent methyltransferase
MANIDQTRKRVDEVSRFYEDHGAHFARTRFALWPWMREIAMRVLPGMTVVDVGAGNARFLEAFGNDVRYVGIEPSSALRDAAKPKLHEKASIEYGLLPHLDVENAIADLTTCIAVFHHLPRSLHHSSMQELIRITKPGGLICISVWNARGKGFLRYPLAWVAAWLRVSFWKGLHSGECYVPWKSGTSIANRYVYAWTKTALQKLGEEYGEVISCEYVDDEKTGVWNGKNIVLVVKKYRDRSLDKNAFYS